MSSESICIICCNPIKTLSIGVCEHTEICADCIHRNSALYKQCECSICKKDLSFVIFCAPGERSKFKFPRSKEEAEDREHYWIEKLKSQDESIGYNVTGGGYGGKNFASSTYEKIFETKRKNNSVYPKQKNKTKNKQIKIF